MIDQKCNCKESSCTDDCTRNHTHKTFSCAICKPKMIDQKKLQLIREECKKANPEKFKRSMGINPKDSFDYDTCWGEESKEPVALADVLMVLPPNLMIDKFGDIIEKTLPEMARFGKKGEYKNKKINWNLKETLENQSEETINFLYKILK